jgi:zinc/manganese transport system permease protein
MEILSLLKWPLVACLVLPWMLVYLGLHVVGRGIIFVDLALAQVAALGTCVSILLGHDVHDWQSFAWSVGFTLGGAILFTLTRSDNRRVPQEALIGIIYVVAAAGGILILSRSAGGKEELQRSLVGELLVVGPGEILRTFALYAVIGLIHFVFRRKFIALSFGTEQATAGGLSARWWDFVFYVLFGFVVTSFVHIGGVLLVFSYLIVPAVCANYLADTLRARLLAGWAVATFASAASLVITVQADLPIGAAIVCVLGLTLLVVGVGVRLLRGRPAAGADKVKSSG